MMEEKNLQLDRLVFFSDAVVAIAITLLALDIKINQTENGHLHFADIGNQWHVFLAFSLSFFNIANFWKTHHSFFIYIKKIDDRLLWFNLLWLLFIVVLPFSTSLVSNFFFDTAAIFVYSANTLLIAVFQNMIWDYASDHKFLNGEKTSREFETRIRAFCNLDMINGIVAIIISFFSPLIAFIALFTKLPMIVAATIYYRRIKKSAKR